VRFRLSESDYATRIPYPNAAKFRDTRSHLGRGHQDRASTLRLWGENTRSPKKQRRWTGVVPGRMLGPISARVWIAYWKFGPRTFRCAGSAPVMDKAASSFRPDASGPIAWLGSQTRERTHRAPKLPAGVVVAMAPWLTWEIARLRMSGIPHRRPSTCPECISLVGYTNHIVGSCIYTTPVPPHPHEIEPLCWDEPLCRVKGGFIAPEYIFFLARTFPNSARPRLFAVLAFILPVFESSQLSVADVQPSGRGLWLRVHL